MRVLIYGAGQAGLSVLRITKPSVEIVAFADSNPAKWGGMLSGLDILSPDEGIAVNPDEIWIAIINRDAQEEVSDYLKRAGYPGMIRTLDELRDRFDFRAASMMLVSEQINKREVPGAVAELGVYKGDFSILLRKCFPGRKLFLFDTFDGFDDRDLSLEDSHTQKKSMDFSDTSPEYVLARFENTDDIVVCEGWFPKTAEGLEERFAFVSIDPDLYEPTYSGLKFFYPRINSGGSILIHDYNSMQFPGVRQAVDRFCDEEGVYIFPLLDIHGSAIIMKP